MVGRRAVRGGWVAGWTKWSVKSLRRRKTLWLMSSSMAASSGGIPRAWARSGSVRRRSGVWWLVAGLLGGCCARGWAGGGVRSLGGWWWATGRGLVAGGVRLGAGVATAAAAH